MTDNVPAPAPQGTPNPDPNPNPSPDPAPPPAGTPNPDPAPNPGTPDPAPPEPIKDAWGEKWREESAGDDAKLLARLQRYKSPKDAVTALIAAQNKIADGSFKKAPGDKATPEEIAEYRKQAGIPEKPEGYFENLPNGLVIGDEDKPVFDDLAKSLHAAHVEPRTMHAITKWYYDFQDRTEAAQHEANLAAKVETEDAMRQAWGPDYRANINIVNTFVKSMPAELQDMLYKSVTADGKQIMNSPQMINWLATQARELNYTGSVLPTGESNAKSIDAEMAEINKLMGDKSSKYWKGPESAKLQARWRDLFDMKERIKSRAA